ncbi:alpha/beta hydrolase [Longibacter salinarum]|uniref:Alpha/beta hydrolase n=1 Tax=Longibacter salinarum TaxID=1850348 RepID=A0A2A8D1B7_9BACT|nr:alpha/beta fold hydrolase [Longibacter salinarum]PEN14438.1 alpha/beta hydrolase [Longibacter salinarum]
MDLHYAEYGDEGPALIILHGLLGAHGNWHTLSRTRFSEHSQVYAVDQRNHGESPHSDQFDYDVMAVDTRDFIEQHHLGTATLLGHSMGGKTAMQTALTYPDIVDRLIVVDMSPRSYPPSHEPLLNALQRIDPTDYNDRSAIDDVLAKDVPSFSIRQFLLKNLDYDRDAEHYRWKMNLPVIAANYGQVNKPVQADQPFDKPALFIRGGTSSYVQDEDMDRINELFPQAELVTVEGAGHWVHAEKPTELADAVESFINQTA